MGNCLVTKLKGNVDNDNLPILGYMKYRVNLTVFTKGATTCFKEDAKLILLDATWTSNGTREIIVSANTTFYPNATTITPDVVGQEYCTILIPKYTCYNYGGLFPMGSVAEVEYTGYEFGAADETTNFVIDLTNLQDIYGRGQFGVRGIEYAPLEKARIFKLNSGKMLNGLDLTQLGAGGLLQVFNLTDAGVRDHVYGSLDNLGKSINNLNWSEGWLPQTKEVSIDLVNFVNNCRSAGKTTGEVNLKDLGALTVKVNGTVIDVVHKANNIVAWTSDSITLDGEPIG